MDFLDDEEKDRHAHVMYEDVPSDNDDYDDAAGRAAFDSIKERVGLDQWTSPRLGRLPIGGFLPKPTAAEDWMMDEEDDDDYNEDVTMGFQEMIDEPPPPTAVKASRHSTTPASRTTTTPFTNKKRMTITTPARSRALQRANTPVIANKSPAATTTMTTTIATTTTTARPDNNDGEDPYAASSTPAMHQHQHQIVVHSNPSYGLVVAAGRSIRRGAGSSHTEYKRYYDALVHFKRHVGADEVFLKTLNIACWERADTYQTQQQRQAKSSSSFQPSQPQQQEPKHSLLEGNFWRLLCSLHQLDPSAVLWDASTPYNNNSSSLDRFLQDLAGRYPHATPEYLLDVFWQTAPLVLRRRRTVQHWLEACFDHVLPADAERRVVPNKRLLVRPTTTTTTTTTTGPGGLTNKNTKNNKNKKNHALRQALGMYETEHDARLFRSALALMLAGRLDDAMALAVDMDAAWRARLWSGGKPYGHTITSTTMMVITDNAKDGDDQVTYESHGNPHRALWRSIMFALADDAEEQTDANYAAMNALLSSNFKRAIDNEALRSWDKALYAALKCSLDRTEDLLLHYHNLHRRQASPPYPGVEHFEKERDHLNATSDFSQMDERTAIETIKAAPFEAMHPDDVVADAICRFILGRHTLHELLAECVRYLKDIQSDDGSVADFERVLRFITHVAIYLDLKLGVNQNDLSPLKDELIQLYLDHLSTREDLWYMSVLYATFLPRHVILNKLPALLLDTEGQHERQHIVGELQEFLPPDTVRDILCATVELSLDEPDRYADDLAPTGADTYKMRSIHWLCFDPEHLREALIAANSLLRYFLLTGNKDESAIMLMDDILPSGLYSTIRDWPDESVSEKPQVKNALMEFSSFESYLEGMKHLAGWKKTMKALRAAELTHSDMLTLLDQHQLSDFDKDIARSQHNRNVVESNRDVCKKVVLAATKAQGELLQVVTHPGGLLNTVSDVMLDGEDQRVRRLQLAQLRLQLIPKTVQQYFDVCTKTAETLFDSLNAVAAAIGEEGSSPLDALREIDNGESEPDDDDGGANHRHCDAAAVDSFLLRNSSFSPLVWTQKALELLVYVQDDSTGLRTNVKSGDYMMMLHKLQRGALVMHEEYQHSMRATSAPLPWNGLKVIATP